MVGVHNLFAHQMLSLARGTCTDAILYQKFHHFYCRRLLKVEVLPHITLFWPFSCACNCSLRVGHLI